MLKGYMLLIAALVKSALYEGDKEFIDSTWGQYLMEMFDWYHEMEDEKDELNKSPSPPRM